MCNYLLVCLLLTVSSTRLKAQGRQAPYLFHSPLYPEGLEKYQVYSGALLMSLNDQTMRRLEIGFYSFLNHIWLQIKIWAVSIPSTSLSQGFFLMPAGVSLSNLSLFSKGWYILKAQRKRCVPTTEMLIFPFLFRLFLYYKHLKLIKHFKNIYKLNFKKLK